MPPPNRLHIDFPLAIDGRGRTAEVDDADYVRDLIAQVLFTAPGERLNRPDFGSGLLGLTFAPNGDELAAAVRFAIEANLQRLLPDVVEPREVAVEADGATLRVAVRYLIRTRGEERVAQLEHPLAIS